MVKWRRQERIYLPDWKRLSVHVKEDQKLEKLYYLVEFH